MYVAEVAVGERVGTEGSQHGPVVLAVLVLVVFEDVHGREIAAHEAAGLVLVGPGGTQHVGALAVEQAGVQFSRHGGEVLLLVVPAGLEELGIGGRTAVGVAVIRVRVDGVHRAGRGVGVEVVRVAHAEVELVLGVDDPVQTAHDLVVRGAQGIALVTARIVSVFAVEGVQDFLHEGFRRADDIRIRDEIRVHAAGSRAHDLVGTGNGIGRVFGVDEEEQLVLDDGAAHGESDRVIQEVGLVQVFAFHLVAADGLGGVVVIDGGVEVVGTALGDGVDRTAGKAGVTDVERGDVHAHLLDGVQGDRASAGRQVGTDTEGVVEGRTVHGDIGGTVVSAAHGQAVGGGGGLRRELHHVVHAAAYGREGLHRTLADGGTGAGALDVHAGVIAVGHEHGRVEVQGFILQETVHEGRFTEGSIDILVFDLPVTEHFDVHGIRTAGGDAVDAVVAVLVRDGIVSGAGRTVRGDDGGACDRTALVGYASSQGGSRHLGMGDDTRYQHRGGEEKEFEFESHKVK